VAVFYPRAPLLAREERENERGRAGALFWGSLELSSLNLSLFWFHLVPLTHTHSSLSSPSRSSPSTHSDELVAKAAGRDMWHEDWLDAPWGTTAAPVEVTSVFSERVVGVPDPADDSIVWWGTVREGEPPRQIIEGGEYFVLKKIGDGGGGHH
jgi:cytochrome c oxidase subunit 5b